MKQLSICLLGLCLLSCNDAEPNDAPLLNPSDAEGISDAQGIADAISDTDLIDAESSADSAQVDADVSLPDLPGPQDSAQPDASEQNDAEISTDEDTASTADTDDAADDTPPPPEPSKTLCAPCTNNSECVDVGDEICARLDGDATACVQPCSAGCEEGYECGTVVNLEGDDIEACVPTNGPCACTDDYIGSETLCWTSNAIGSCQGSKVCTATGWTTCDASEATAEVCGGGDENCDGVVDEENAEGCYTLYADKDQDGFGSETDTKCLCDSR